MNITKNAHAVPRNSTTRYHWIRYRLSEAGSSFAGLAVENGVTTEAVCKALRHPSRRLEDAIAAKIGLSPREVFPERFDETGNRLAARDWQSSIAAGAGERSNGVAA